MTGFKGIVLLKMKIVVYSPSCSFKLSFIENGLYGFCGRESLQDVYTALFQRNSKKRHIKVVHTACVLYSKSSEAMIALFEKQNKIKDIIQLNLA